jgi:hypothetical protein
MDHAEGKLSLSMQDVQKGAYPKKRKKSAADQFAVVKYRSETYCWTQKLNREYYGVERQELGTSDGQYSTEVLYIVVRHVALNDPHLLFVIRRFQFLKLAQVSFLISPCFHRQNTSYSLPREN